MSMSFSNNNNNNNNNNIIHDNQDDLPAPRISLNESYCTNSRLLITVMLPPTTTPTTTETAATTETAVVHLELWVRGRETWRELQVGRSTTSLSNVTWTVNHEGALEAAGQELHIKCRAKYKSYDNQNTTTVTTILYSQWTEGTLLVTICPQKRRQANVTPDPVRNSDDHDTSDNDDNQEENPDPAIRAAHTVDSQARKPWGGIC